MMNIVRSIFSSLILSFIIAACGLDVQLNKPGSTGPDSAPLVPLPPASAVLKSSGSGADRISLSWDAVEGVTGYRVGIVQSPNAIDSCTPENSTLLGPDSLDFEFDLLSGNTTYTVFVCSMNEDIPGVITKKTATTLKKLQLIWQDKSKTPMVDFNGEEVFQDFGFVGDRILYPQLSAEYGNELWAAHRNTMANPVMLADMNPGEASSKIVLVWTFNGWAYIVTEGAAGRRQIWVSDGTPSGTHPLFEDSEASSSTRGPYLSFNNGDRRKTHNPNFGGGVFVASGSDVYFSTYKKWASTEMDLWKIDLSDFSINSVANVSLPSFINAEIPLASGGDYILFSNGYDEIYSYQISTSQLHDAFGGAFNHYSFIWGMEYCNGKFYFALHDFLGGTGNEPYYTDGTPSSVTILKDISTGFSNGSYPIDFACSGSNLYFSASDSLANGREIFKSDGTAPGTSLLDFNPGVEHGHQSVYYPMGSLTPFVHGGTDYIVGYFSPPGLRLKNYEMGYSDGTTVSLMPSPVGTAPIGSQPREAISGPNETIYFTANDNSLGFELYKTNPTDGTTLIKDINLGPGSSNISGLKSYGGNIYFYAFDGTQTSIWISDGTSANTKSLNSENLSTSGIDFTIVAKTPDDKLIVRIGDQRTSIGESWYELDPVSGLKIYLGQINAFESYSTLKDSALIGDMLFFQGDDLNTNMGKELYSYNFSTKSLGLLKNIKTPDYPANWGFSEPSEFHTIGNRFYFNGRIDGGNFRVYASDQTSGGTVSTGLETGENFFKLNGDLHFFAGSNNNKTLRKVDGTTYALSEVSVESFLNKPFAPYAKNILHLGSQAILRTDTTTYGQELYKTDGSSLTLLKDISPGVGDGVSTLLEVHGGKAWFVGNNGAGNEIHYTDGTLAGTKSLSETYPAFSSLTHLKTYLLGDRLYFVVRNSESRDEIWSMGSTMDDFVQMTTQGTANPGEFESVSQIMELNGKLLFLVDDGVNDSTLWVAEGYELPIKPLFDSEKSKDLLSVSQLLSGGNLAFAQIETKSKGTEIWKTDGTPENTLIYQELQTGARGILSLSIFEFEGEVYFECDHESKGKLIYTVAP